MDVKVSTIVSRFSFPFPSFDSEGDNDDTNSQRKVSTPFHEQSSSLRSKSTQSLSGPGFDGSNAFVQQAAAEGVAAAAASSALSLAERTRSAARPSTARPKSRTTNVDLTRLASCVWNAELQRSATTGEPTVCVLQPPPFVFDNVVYRAASVYVLPSGIVRLVTYGSVAATHRIARRVRDALSEAYVSTAARQAAKEERRLLRAVFAFENSGSDNAGENFSFQLDRLKSGSRKSAREPEEGKSLSLADALASSGSGTKQFAYKQTGEQKKQRSREIAQSSMSSSNDVVSDAFKIDFIQSFASPRWDEIAGLREALFTAGQERGDENNTNSGVLQEGNESEVDKDSHSFSKPALNQSNGDTLCDEDADSVAIHQARPSRAARPAHVPVLSASVNVRGDAPMAWWRWFLAAGALHKDAALSVKPLPPAHDVFASDHEADTDTTDGKEGCVFGVFKVPVEEEKFWTCAGHNDIAASSARAASFVTYLQQKRMRVAHHVVSFKVRRNASQNSIQLLLEWNAAPFPSPLPQTCARVQRGVLHLPPKSLAAQSSGVSSKRIVAASSEQQQQQQQNSSRANLRLSLTSQPVTAARPAASTSGDGWVSEASVANFFLESTFIAESTTPYGMESTRPAEGLSNSGLTSALQSVSLLPSTARSAEVDDDNVAQGARALLAGVTMLHGDAPPRLPTQRQSASFITETKLEGSLNNALKRQRPTKAEKAAPVVKEQVSCLIHRTGRVQLSTATELAIRQVCDVLLIPFLVTTAELTF